MSSQPASPRRMPERVVNHSSPGTDRPLYVVDGDFRLSKFPRDGGSPEVGSRLPVAIAFALLLAFLASGCETAFGTVWKTDYWDEIHEQSRTDEKARLLNDPATAYF